MKKSIIYLFLLNFFFSFSQNKIGIPQALNIASKQSMLCERLAKEKVFHVTNPNNFSTEQKLGVSLIQFERNISRLKKIALPDETLFLITTTEMLWFTYKKNLLDKDHISTIKTMEYSMVMLSYCQQVYNSILKHAEKEKTYPYNTSVKDFPDAYVASHNIKHLSQKLSLYYNAYYSKVSNYDEAYFNTIINSIDTSVNSIKKIKNSNSLILERTNKIESEWNSLKNKIKQANKTHFEIKEDYLKPEYVLKQNNELLKDADLLTRYYKEQNETK